MTLRDVVVESELAAPPARVWQLVSDITLMPRFSSELHQVSWADGFDRPALGARFLGANRHPAVGEWTTTSQIVDFDPPRLFGWAVGHPDRPAAIWRFELEPTPTGTRLRYLARLGPGRSGVTALIERDPDRAEQIIANRMQQWRAGMQAVVAGIEALADG